MKIEPAAIAPRQSGASSQFYDCQHGNMAANCCFLFLLAISVAIVVVIVVAVLLYCCDKLCNVIFAKTNNKNKINRFRA